MRVDPVVIRRHVIRHEVEHQLQSALLQALSQAAERLGAAQIAMNRVAPDSEPGAGDVVVREIRQRIGEFAAPSGMRARNCLGRRAGLPHAQQPDPVEAQLGEAIQFGIRNIVERRAPADARDNSVSQTRVLIWYSTG